MAVCPCWIRLGENIVVVGPVVNKALHPTPDLKQREEETGPCITLQGISPVAHFLQLGCFSQNNSTTWERAFHTGTYGGYFVLKP